MLNRIKEILESENLNYGTFADEIGVQRSSLSHILNGRNNPSLDFVIKTLQRFPKINSDWLILGEGSMYREEREEIINEQSSETKPFSSPDLFSSIGNNVTDRKEERNEELKSDMSENEELKTNINNKYVSQILIFYSDSTYQVYKPEKPQ